MPASSNLHEFGRNKCYREERITVLFKSGPDLNQTDIAQISKASREKDLVEPMVGLRGCKFSTRKLHLDFAGDVCGVANTEKQATHDRSAAGLVSYDFARWFTLSSSCKALD